MLLTKPKSLTLTGCIDYYLEVCRAKGQSENTVVSKGAALSLFQKWGEVHGIVSANLVDVDVLDSYQQHLNQYRKALDGEPLCRATIRYRLTAVKVLIRTLFIKGVVSVNAVEHFELPKNGRRLPKPILSKQEVIKVLQQAEHYGLKGIRDRAIMATYYASGIRRFELGTLTLDDVDFEQHHLRVNQGKGFKDRYVPIARNACLWIYRYLKEVRPKFANSYSGKALFLANSGKPFRAAQLSELVAKYIKLSDIRKTGACNQYRHAAATHMVDNGADIRHVQEFLGHADLSTTQVYVHVSMTKLREVYNRTHPAAHEQN
ncbi:tyrosine-type recombinase/integrase [Bowmanella dokdonensis]|uniref:Tyrosine-type recombinase/integrase n=1 Tax=Bowmanella dokdonensis TaxID=751969 RepID=A0A939ISN4_9ALTE|nr:tyrosine-type recombinase/integrase [Bowmanella dokdonensis]MBN7827369.1 tyrosine-type recombinase/integrase [Bowmanella dokdonensis]